MVNNNIRDSLMVNNEWILVGLGVVEEKPHGSINERQCLMLLAAVCACGVPSTYA